MDREGFDTMKPVIGITTAHDITNNRFFVSYDYLYAIINNGGLPLLLPPCPFNEIQHQLSMIDGILLTGGGDINPLLYDEEPSPLIGETSLLRDDHEILLTKMALEDEKLPILGICRGLQVLCVASGGTLIQDISKSTVCHAQKSARNEETHSIDIMDNTLLSRVLGGTKKTSVNSLHHQAVLSYSKNFIVSAVAKDGIIEALEGKKGFILGIQWHAENLYTHNEAQNNIFKTFISKAENKEEL